MIDSSNASVAAQAGKGISVNPDDAEPPIRRRESREIYRNRFATIYDDDVVFPGHRAGRYLRIVEGDGKPGVVVLPVCGRSVGLVLTFRYPTGRWEWGVPRGYGHGDDPVASALAELEEELGARPDRLTPLGRAHANSGILAGHSAFFLAEYAQPVASPLDTDEISAVRWVSFVELGRMLADDTTIMDGFTLAVVGAAVARGLVRFPEVSQ